MTDDSNLSALRSAASRDPMNGQLRYQLAAELAHQGDYDAAVLEFTAATMLSPNLHIAKFQLALLQLTMRRVDQSMATLAPLKKLDATSALRLFAEGVEAMSRDEFPLAIEKLQRGIALNRENAPLNRDMQLLVDRITALQQQSSTNPSATDVRTDFSLYGVTRH